MPFSKETLKGIEEENTEPAILKAIFNMVKDVQSGSEKSLEDAFNMYGLSIILASKEQIITAARNYSQTQDRVLLVDEIRIAIGCPRFVKGDPVVSNHPIEDDGDHPLIERSNENNVVVIPADTDENKVVAIPADTELIVREYVDGQVLVEVPGVGDLLVSESTLSPK